MRTRLEPDPAETAVGSGAVLRSFLRYKELCVVTRDPAGRLVIVTSFSLDGDVITRISPKLFKGLTPDQCRTVVTDHMAVARGAFANLWRGVDRSLGAVRVLIGICVGTAAQLYGGHSVGWLLGLGALAVPPKIALLPVSIAVRAYCRRLLANATRGNG
jgi:hypothetical protein